MPKTVRRSQHTTKPSGPDRSSIHGLGSGTCPPRPKTLDLKPDQLVPPVATHHPVPSPWSNLLRVRRSMCGRSIGPNEATPELVPRVQWVQSYLFSLGAQTSHFQSYWVSRVQVLSLERPHGGSAWHHLMGSGFHGLPNSGPGHPRNHVTFQGVYGVSCFSGFEAPRRVNGFTSTANDEMDSL